MRVLSRIVLVIGIVGVMGCSSSSTVGEPRKSMSDTEQAVAHTLDAFFNAKPVLINGVLKSFPETAFLQDRKHKVFFLNRTAVADSLFVDRGYRKAPDLKKANLLKFYEGDVILIQFLQDDDGKMLFFWGTGPTCGMGYRIEINESDPEQKIKYQAHGMA